MTAPAPELLPCPFCGSTNLKSGGDDKFVGTRCVDCEASGPNHYGKTDWNTRQAASVGAEVARSEVLIEELTAVQIAFGQATTQTEIDPERRWQAIKLVTEFLGKLRLSHGAAQKSEVRSREAIARIVDHDAWELYDNANTLTKMQKPISLWRIEPSLAKADAILTLSAAQAVPNPSWRCFHCGEVFTDPKAAANHFGVDHVGDETLCQMAQVDGGIARVIADLAEELQRYRSEDNTSYREFYALGADHRAALIKEEQKGYDRGLADARAEASPVPSAECK